MKLKDLMLKNFLNVSKISVNFDESLTFLIGTNGAGKTKIGLEAVWIIMQGLAAKAKKGSEVFLGERFRFIGPQGRTAKGSITIYDEKNDVTHKVTRTILKHTTNLKIESSDGIQRGQEFLDSLFSSIMIDPRRFFKLSPKDQALAFGVDTSEFDEKKKVLEAERLELHRKKSELKALIQAAGEVEKVEPVSISELLMKQKEITRFNEDVAKKERDKNQLTKDIDQLEKDAHRLRNELQKVTAKLSLKKDELEAFEIPELKDPSATEAKMEAATETNKKATKYEEHLENKKKHDKAKEQHSAKADEISVLDGKRTAYIKTFKLPYNNMAIDDNGGLLIDGRPFNDPYWSEGEALRFSALLMKNILERNGDMLEYVWISGAQDLDEDNLDSLLSALKKAGLQVGAEYVSKKKFEGKNCILLRQCEVVESYEDKKKGAELA